MLFVSLLLLYDECRSGVTIQLSETPRILKREYNFPSVGAIFCLNFTVPNLAISFLQKANATIQVFRTASSTASLVLNSTFANDPLSVADFGDDIGMVMMRATSISQLIYSTVAWPDNCKSRVLSNCQSDVFAVDDQCENDGCVDPDSTICYFNSLHSESLYAIEVDLRHGDSRVQVINATGGSIKNFKTKDSASLNYAASEPVYFTIFNGNDENSLSKSVSITTSSFGVSDETRAYYNRESHSGITLFYEQPQMNSGIPIGANFAMSSIVFLGFVLAVITYLFLHPDPTAVEGRAGSQSEISAQAGAANPQGKKYAVVASDDENAGAFPLEEIP
jgi:hypothetical protein